MGRVCCGIGPAFHSKLIEIERGGDVRGGVVVAISLPPKVLIVGRYSADRLRQTCQPVRTELHRNFPHRNGVLLTTELVATVRELITIAAREPVLHHDSQSRRAPWAGSVILCRRLISG